MIGRLAPPAASSLKRDAGGYAQQHRGEKYDDSGNAGDRPASVGDFLHIDAGVELLGHRSILALLRLEELVLGERVYLTLGRVTAPRSTTAAEREPERGIWDEANWPGAAVGV
jgi:hypothetical protein